MARPMTLEQLQEALRTAERPTDDGPGFRVEEICEATGMSHIAVRGMIRQGLKAGTVERTIRRHERLDGKLAPVPAYIFLDPSPAKKARRA